MEKIWLQSYAKAVPKEIDFERITLAEALSRTANRFPNRPALLFQGTTVTYKDLDDMVSRFATALVSIGVKPGDKVALLLPNLVQAVVAIYGSFRAGATVVMNNPLYTDRELEHQLNDSGSTYLVCLDVLAPRMIALREKTGVKKIILLPHQGLLAVLSQTPVSLCQKRHASEDTRGSGCDRIRRPRQKPRAYQGPAQTRMGRHRGPPVHRWYHRRVQRRSNHPFQPLL